MEIKFRRDTSFRKQFFVPDSFAHPAKMDAQLLLWIVGKYTDEGETILDPMAGSGTMMLACTMGRDVVLVELEEKFCKMMADNWEKVRMRPQLGSQMGNCQIIQGDARQLEGLVDKVITSPPYAEVNQMPRDNPDPTADKNARANIGKAYSDNPNNLGNLPYGQIDKIVTSPPYSDEPTISESYLKIRREIGRDTSKPSQQYRKYDSIITSPPYEGTVVPYEDDAGKKRTERANKRGFNTKNSGIMRAIKAGGAYKGFSQGYSNSGSQIGNLKSDSYLEAMLQVYAQCYKVLKPRGLMILVTKNFLREQKEIRLDTGTIKLCEQVGFKFLERHYRKLPSQSFWRVIYAKKYPDAPVLDKEDVLVFRK